MFGVMALYLKPCWIGTIRTIKKEESLTLFLYLGKVSSALYLRGNDIKSCFPDTYQTNTLCVNISKKDIYKSLIGKYKKQSFSVNKISRYIELAFFFVF